MSCSNCYNGCAEIVSDKCVKYTGIDVPLLGIQTGDSLSYIEQALIEFLTSALNGTGILPAIDSSLLNPETLCSLVKANLPTCGEITLNGYIETLIKTACNLQNITLGLGESIAAIEADYDLVCIDEPGVFGNSGTHPILQAVINKLCAIDTDLAALTLDVSTNYVKLADLDDLIAAYLAAQPVSSQQYTKMVPYTVVEYYGSLSYFDATGAGLANLGWDKIYLCNGLNGTPDKRGRVAVGAIQTVPGPSLGSAVNPAVSGNPNYAVGDTAGANTVTLDATQIPAHTHTATVTDTHYHFAYADVVNTVDVVVDSTNYVARALNLGSATPLEYTMNSSPTVATVGRSSATQGTLAVSNSSVGGGLGHSNIQPVLACYYIMYIP